MVSTPPPSDDAEGHPPEESPHDEEEKTASPSKKEAKQPKTSNRERKLRHKQRAHYRTHTNDFPSQTPGDPVMRQAMRFGIDPNTFPPPPGAYQTNTNPSYYPSPNLPPLAGYSSPYTYPEGGGYFSVPRASAHNPQYFSPQGYDVPPSGYSDPGYDPAGSYGYREEVPPYPEYPTRESKRAPVRPKPLRQPKPQTEPNLSSLRRDGVYQRQRQRRPSIPTRERASSEDGITMQDIMAELRNLQRQLYQAEIQSDPGRIQGRPRRSPSVTSQYTSDDTKSLNIERERSRQLTSIIYRLLEDRQRPEYQDSLGRSSRQMMDLLQGSIGSSDREIGLVSQRDAREIESKLDTIIEYLQLENGLENEPIPQRLREGHESRLIPLVLRGQPSVASGSSVHEPASPTLSRAMPRRRQTLPSVIRPPQDSQPSNQGRARQLPTRLPEPDDDDDEVYEQFRRAAKPARTRISSTQSAVSQDRRRAQSTAGQSDVRPPARKIVEGDQQKVRPNRFAYVQTEDEQDEEPARAPVPPYPVPDPPGQSKRRRSLQSVRFR
ncbi:hypothetical protein FGADI_11021 [Fusarium gaditjirri]|uniref:Uncharacterized protein n=1 Tax=Fusarium gaditjirri TaxID=282569 RepID=A0A8H4SVU8_9HYPO|nr:hypothetical protein FGADI_11021 [Fusarium gaditjirri]